MFCLNSSTDSMIRQKSNLLTNLLSINRLWWCKCWLGYVIFRKQFPEFLMSGFVFRHIFMQLESDNLFKLFMTLRISLITLFAFRFPLIYSSHVFWCPIHQLQCAYSWKWLQFLLVRLLPVCSWLLLFSWIDILNHTSLFWCLMRLADISEIFLYKFFLASQQF